jgi:hypothetical protein
MKRTPLVLNRLIIALALATQLFLLAPATQAAQNTNSSTTHDMHEGHRASQPTRHHRRSEAGALPPTIQPVLASLSHVSAHANLRKAMLS